MQKRHQRDPACDYALAAQDVKRSLLATRVGNQDTKWRCSTCKGYTTCKKARVRQPFLHRHGSAGPGRSVNCAARFREVLVRACHEFSVTFTFKRSLGCVEDYGNEVCTCWYCADCGRSCADSRKCPCGNQVRCKRLARRETAIRQSTCRADCSVRGATTSDSLNPMRGTCVCTTGLGRTRRRSP